MNKISRRDFITSGSMIVIGAIAIQQLPGCSKKPNLEIDEFKKLSSVLTGFKIEELDNSLASTYLKSINDFPPNSISLNQLYEDLNLNSGNLPDQNTIEKIIFGNPEKKVLADTILYYWMSGVYKTKDGLKVSDYQQMYAFKATGYLIPNAQCRGEFGFWADKPVLS